MLIPMQGLGDVGIIADLNAPQMTGTPGGVGIGMKPPQYLKDGDEVIVDIEGIGKVVNTMKFE